MQGQKILTTLKLRTSVIKSYHTKIKQTTSQKMFAMHLIKNWYSQLSKKQKKLRKQCNRKSA